MKYKEYITNFTKRLFKKPSIVRDPQIMHPDREWAIGLLVAALIFSVSGYWSIHTYIDNRSAVALEMVDDKEEAVYRASIVKEALEIVRARERSLQRSTQSVVIPEPAPEVASTTLEEVGDTQEATSASTTPVE